MIVVDTNLIVYLHLDSPFTALAGEALRRDPRWIAPLLWRSEFRNVLARTMREHDLNLEPALRLAAEAEDLIIEPKQPVTHGEVLRLVEGSGCSAYDCEFVTLAIRLDAPLVTSDREVLKAFPAVAVSLEDFTSDPPPANSG